MSAGKEDVYESEDTVENDLNSKFARQETTNPDQVELIHIDLEAAKKKFAGRVLNVENVDFSDSIWKKRRHAYGNSAFVLEVVGSATEKETAEQKFNRLSYEIGELREQLANEGENRSELLTENALNSLLDELKAIKLAKDSATTSIVTAVATDKKPSTGQQPVDSAVAAIDARIRRLENILGPLSSRSQSSVSLIESLEDLRYRTEALNMTYLDGVDSRLNATLSKLDQVESRKSQGENGDFQAKVDAVYELMNKWDATCTALPTNVKRLQALRALHEQASQFGERLSQLAGIKEQMEKAATASRIGIAELQGQTKEEIASLSKQIKALETKLSN